MSPMCAFKALFSCMFRIASGHFTKGKNFSLSTKAAWSKGKQKNYITKEVHSKQLDVNTAPTKKKVGFFKQMLGTIPSI